MDLKHYYRKIRETEQSFSDEFPVVVSFETSDGGKAGRLVEVSRSVAAKMIVDGRAAIATPEQHEAFLTEQNAVRLAAQKADLARRVQLAIVSDNELSAIPTGKKK